MIGSSVYAVIVLIVMILMGYALSNAITRPISDLQQAVSAAVQGAGPDIRDRSGSKEIQQLAQSLDTLIQQNKDQSDSLSRVRTKVLNIDERRSLSATPLTKPQLESGRLTAATVLSMEIPGLVYADDFKNHSNVGYFRRYYDEMLSILTAHQGRLVGFQGSVLTAGFGTRPRDVPGQVSSLGAAHAALELLELGEEFSGNFSEEYEDRSQVNIGLAWGQIRLAQLGSNNRPHDVILGKSADDAGTLRIAARNLGRSSILMSEQVVSKLEAVRDHFEIRKTGRMELGGSRGSIIAYELVGRKLELVPKDRGGSVA